MVRERLSDTDEPPGKAEIVARAGMPEAAWAPTTQRLVDAGQVRNPMALAS